MLKAIFDSTVLVSAFLVKRGVSLELLDYARRGAFSMCLSEAILAETQRVLLQHQRIRKRYHYADEDAKTYIELLAIVSQPITDLPEIHGVVRDPNDDVIIATAVKAGADYLVTRDKDLLVLNAYQQTIIVTPEQFIEILRAQEHKP